MSKTTHIFLLFFLLMIPLLTLRDYSPTNELRYVGIAGEALAQHHFFAFYIQGEIYADKPPFFFWLMMLEKTLFGQFSVLTLTLLNLIPSFLVVWLMSHWTRKVLKDTERIAAGVMLLTSGIYLGSSVIIRMDMLMTLFIVLSLYTFYRIFQNEHRPWEKWILPVYLFMGMFTKWPVGAFIPMLAIGVFLIWKKQLFKLFRYIGPLQMGLFILLTGLWWLAAWREGGTEYIQNLLFKQTLGRAVDAFHHKEPFYYYLMTMWYSMAPWIFLYVAGLFYAIRKKLIQTDMEKLFVSLIFSTFVFLSFMSGKIEIYLLPIYPFLAFFTLMMLKKRPVVLADRLALIIPASLFLLPIPAFFIFRNRLDLPAGALPWILGALAVLAVASGYSLYLKKSKVHEKIITLSTGLLLSIFVFSFSIPLFNGYIGFGAMAQQTKQIAETQNIGSVYYYTFRSGEYLSLYFGKEIPPITNLSDTTTWPSKPFLLLIKTVEANKDPILKKAIEGKSVHNSGKYSVVEFIK